jgi:membrane protease YdiL (CAAX protease family)
MPSVADVLFVVTLLVLVSLFEHFIFWPRFRADIAGGAPGARIRGYRRTIIGQSLFTLVAGWLWIAYHRTAGQLRLAPPTGWRLALSIGLVVVMAVLVGRQLRSIMRLPAARRVRARPKLGELHFLLPHTPIEHRWFLALSLVAGTCEEILYRGYLVWFFAPWTGSFGAFIAVVVLFGIGHSYQGGKGAIRATLAGALMSLVVVATNWLVPAMIIHALVNAGSGTVGYLLLRDYPPDIAEPATGVSAEIPNARMG